MSSMSFDQATTVLGRPEWFAAWRADFDASAGYLDRAELFVPVGEALVERCRRYRFPPAAIDTLVTHRAEWDDERIRRLGAHIQWMSWERYAPRTYLQLGWPPPPSECKLLYAYAALGLAPRTEAAHAELGVSPDVTSATLWDVGQQVALHERIHGEFGMAKGWWIVHHLTLHLFRLGRLQFQRAVGRPGLGPIAEGEVFLDVHIPEDGPLTEAACDESFAAARDFFARRSYAELRPEERSPEEPGQPDSGHRPRARYFACSSWLLDPGLLEILPADSNIVRFQRRFELLPGGATETSTVFEFAFDRPDLDRTRDPNLEGLPQNTGLERALVEHYRAGGRIGGAVGVIPIGSGSGDAGLSGSAAA
jgi:hypothetical protein